MIPKHPIFGRRIITAGGTIKILAADEESQRLVAGLFVNSILAKHQLCPLTFDAETGLTRFTFMDNEYFTGQFTGKRLQVGAFIVTLLCHDEFSERLVAGLSLNGHIITHSTCAIINDYVTGLEKFCFEHEWYYLAQFTHRNPQPQPLQPAV